MDDTTGYSMALFDTPSKQSFDRHARSTLYRNSAASSGRSGGGGRNDHTRRAGRAFGRDTGKQAPCRTGRAFERDAA
jgi:hypothetical protein